MIEIPQPASETAHRLPLPQGWRWAKIADVCGVNPRRPAGLIRPDDAPTTFVPMSAAEERDGVIAQPELRPYAEIKKGYTCFEEGDVLFAKITPCMQNGKHAIARPLKDGIGFGSTEFHVLRPGPKVLSQWIHYFIRQPAVLRAATAHFTGAVGQQRVPDSFLSHTEIPVAPLPEQHRIITILAEQLAAVARARTAAEAQLHAASNLLAAYMRRVFDSSEARHWPSRRLAELLASPLCLGLSETEAAMTRRCASPCPLSAMASSI